MGLAYMRNLKWCFAVTVMLLCAAGLMRFAGSTSSSLRNTVPDMAASQGGYSNADPDTTVSQGGQIPVRDELASSADAGKDHNADASNDPLSASPIMSVDSNLIAAAAIDNRTEDLTPEQIAARKEQDVRERFGVIRRRDKWIPTVGDGSNLVYITTGSLPLGRVGQPYEVLFNAESGFVPYQWSIIGGELPAALTLNAISGRLEGTPTNPVETVFFLEVTDSKGAKDMAQYVITVQPEQDITIVTDLLPAAYPGEVYAFQMLAVGGIPPYEWSAVGNLDEIGWLALDQHTGLLSGQIDIAAPVVDIPITFYVSDLQVELAKEFVLYVRKALSILHDHLLPVRASVPWEFNFRATGGAEPYIWGAAGDLPPGLSFTDAGLLSGTPSEPGLFGIAVWVQDALGEVDTVQCDLEVLPAMPVSVVDFHALLSRNSAALKWKLPMANEPLSVRIVRNSAVGSSTPSDGKTVYQGAGNEHLDGDVGEGTYYYTAFLEIDGITATTDPSPILRVTLPPEKDPFADRIVSKELLHSYPFGIDRLPDVVLGAPSGTGLAWGSADVLSLGAAVNDDGGASAPYGGAITLEFTDNLVWDGPGVDFTVFENVFYVYNAEGMPDPETRFMEPAVVSVSQDGVNWRQFKCDFSPRFDPESGALNLRHPYCYNSGFAGVNPVMSNGFDPDPTDPAVSGGDSFDISLLGFDWIRYVRIQSTGSRWLNDSDGDLIHHNEEMGAANRSFDKAGFDLDAVTAIWMERVSSYTELH